MADGISKDKLARRVSELEAALDRFSRQEEISRKRLEYLEKVGRIDQALRSTGNLEIVLWDALGAVMEVFRCDRVWLLQPCDPGAPTWKLTMERAGPQFSGAHLPDRDIPMTPGVAETLRTALGARRPVVYGPGGLPLAKSMKERQVQSQMSLAIRPGIGKAWLLGLHQCSYPRTWSEEEAGLFLDIGHRLSMALSLLLYNRSMRESLRRDRLQKRKLAAAVEERTDELAAANSHLRSLIESLPFDFFALDRDLRYTMQNDLSRNNWGNVIGRSPAEVAGDVEQRALWESNNRRALLGETVSEEVEVTVRGEPRKIFNVIAPIREKDGITGILGVNVDVTERAILEMILAAQRDLAKRVSSCRSLGEAMSVALDTVRGVPGTDGGGAWVFSEEEGRFELAAGRNLSEEFLAAVTLHPAFSPARPGRMIEGKPFFVGRAEVEGQARKAWEEEGLRSMAILPVVVEGRIEGCVSLASRKFDSVPPMIREAIFSLADSLTSSVSRFLAERALRESEEKYRRLVELSPDGVVILQDGRYVFVNEAFTRIFGYTRQDVAAGLSLFQLVGEKDREAVGRRYEERLAGKSLSQTFRLDLLTRDGKVVPCETSASAIEYGGRQADLVVIRGLPEREDYFSLLEAQRDLSVKLNAAQGLEEGMRHCLHAAFLVTGMEAGGVYLFDLSAGSARLAFHENLSADFASKVGEYPLDTPTAAALMAGEPRISAVENLPAPLRAAARDEGIRVLAVVPILHGGIAVGCMNVASRKVREVSPSGREALLTVVGQIGGALARLGAEEALRESEEKYRLLAEQNPHAVVLGGDDGSIIDVNPAACRLFGYSAVEFLSLTREQLHPPGDESFRRAVDARRRDGQFRGRVLLRRKDGSSFPAELSVSAFHDAGGNRQVLAVVTDVSEREESRRLLEIQKDLSFALAETVSLEEGLALCLEAACLSSGMESGGIYLLRPERGVYDLVTSRGLSEGFIAKTKRFPLDSTQGRIVSAGEAIFTSVSTENEDVRRDLEAEGLKGLAVLPIRHDGEVAGCINVASRSAVDIPPHVRAGLLSIASQVGSAIARIRAEEAHRVSEENYRRLVREVPVVTWTSDSAGNTTFISPNVEKIYGFKAEEILAKEEDLWLGRIHEDDRRRVTAAYASLFEGGSDFDEEYRIQRRDGEWIWLHDRAYSIFEKEGRWFAFGAFMDVTERKRAQAELLGSEERFRTLMENIPGLVYRCAIDPPWCLLFASDDSHKMTGYPAESLPCGGCPCLAEMILPEDLPEVEEKVARAVRERRPFELTYRFRRADGEVRWAHDRGRVVCDDKGRPLWRDGVILDITGERAALDALRESEERYRLLTENVSEAILLTDADGRILKTNAAACSIFGFSAGEIVTLRREDFLADPEVLQKKVSSRVRTGRFSGELLFRRRDGATFPGYCTVQAFRTAAGVQMLAVLIWDLEKRKEIEAALLESRERYRRLVDALPLGVEETDGDGRILYANDAFHRILGFEPGELIGTLVSERLPPAEREGFSEALAEIFADCPEPSPWVVRNIRKDGDAIDVQIDWDYRRDGGGDVVGFFAIVSDVTERRRTVVTLRESEEKFRTLAEQSPNMIFIGREGRLIYMNRQGELLTGYSAAEMYGEGLDRLGIVLPGDRHRIAEAVDAVEANGEGTEATPLEYTLVARDGRRLETLLSTKLITYRGERATLGIVTDISARKEAEEALRQSEARYRTLVERSRELIFTYDRQGRFSFFNPAFEEMTGWKSEEWLGRPFREIIHPEDLPMVTERFNEIRKGAILPPAEVRVRTKSGGFLSLEYSTVPLLLGGDVEGAWGIGRDVTARKRADEDRRKLTALREREGVSRWLHDHLGADLYNILLLADSIAKKKEALPPEVEQQVEWISETSRTALSGIRNYLDFSSQAGVSVEEMVDNMEKYGASVLNALGVSFRFLREGDLKGCRLTGVRSFNLHLIYKEALTNVVKHSRARHVEVKVAAAGEVMTLRIADDGRGFSPGVATGRFGTANIRARAEELGGGLVITSGPGGGTVIELSIPCRD